MLHFERIVEEKIRQALQNGAFENLPGAGKPLRLDDDSMVPPDLRMAYKLLKDAHCLPPELELHKEILQMKDLLRGIDDESERTRKIREINLLITRLNLLRKCPLSLEAQQMVVSRLWNRNDPAAP
jgi:DnaJ homologue, subfamily C, member 28, conserved domain